MHRDVTNNIIGVLACHSGLMVLGMGVFSHPPLAVDVITKIPFWQTVLDSVYYDNITKKLATQRCLQLLIRNRTNFPRVRRYESTILKKSERTAPNEQSTRGPTADNSKDCIYDNHQLLQQIEGLEYC